MTLFCKKLFTSFIFLILFGLAGLVIVNSQLSHFDANSFFTSLPRYVMEYLLILAGPFAALFTLFPQMESSQLLLMLGLSGFSVLSWVYILLRSKYSSRAMFLPVSIWVFIGSMNAFYSFDAGV